MSDGLKLQIIGSKVLSQRCSKVEIPPHGLDHSHFGLMHLFMVEHGGVGLAAPQIGDPSRYFIIRRELAQDHSWIFINPEIISSSEDTCSFREGCLSIPGVGLDVERPSTISVRAYDDRGHEFIVENASGLLARVILHEMDHLDGVMMMDRVDLIQRSLASGKLKRARRMGRRTNG